MTCVCLKRDIGHRGTHREMGMKAEVGVRLPQIRNTKIPANTRS